MICSTRLEFSPDIYNPALFWHRKPLLLSLDTCALKKSRNASESVYSGKAPGDAGFSQPIAQKLWLPTMTKSIRKQAKRAAFIRRWGAVSIRNWACIISFWVLRWFSAFSRAIGGCENGLYPSMPRKIRPLLKLSTSIHFHITFWPDNQPETPIQICRTSVAEASLRGELLDLLYRIHDR